MEQELLRLKDKTVKDDQTRKDVRKTVTQSGLIQSGRANAVCTIVHITYLTMMAHYSHMQYMPHYSTHALTFGAKKEFS